MRSKELILKTLAVLTLISLCGIYIYCTNRKQEREEKQQKPLTLEQLEQREEMVRLTDKMINSYE